MRLFTAAGLLVSALLLIGRTAWAQLPPCEEFKGLTDSGYKVSLIRDAHTAWQPAGGEVRFTLKADDIPAPNMHVFVCFRWHAKRGAAFTWLNTPPVRVIDSALKQVTYGVQVPQELDTPNDPTQQRPPWIKDWGNQQRVEYTGFGLIPLGEMRVWATSNGTDWTRFDAVEQVGISYKLLSFLPAAAALLAAWALLLYWAKRRQVQGDPVLRIISSSSGYASLSQFQIMLWTFVIGIGAIYVMALSGSLIDIPQTALGLLGISGIATLGTKLSASRNGADSAPNPPGATTGLEVSGTPTAGSVTLTWTPPAAADPTVAYTVQMREATTLPWATVAPAIAAPPFAVTGLQANTVYDFQVYAVNGAGSGPPAVRLGVATGATAQPPPGAPGPVANLAAQPGAQADSQARLSWTGPAPAPQTYVVQFRALGTLAWSTASGAAATPYTVTGLEGGTDYEFQVFAVNAGIAGQPSPIAALRTADRRPRWSDLVISSDGGNEVDVTRVQMLLFTVIAAVFVAMKLLAESDLPDIPSGILTLMGLSNGVYLGAKFIPGSK